MEQETPIQFATIFKRGAHRVDTCLGAFCRAFDNKGWVIERLTTTPFLKGYFYHHGIGEYKVEVAINTGNNKSLNIHFTSNSGFVTQSGLEHYGAVLVAEVNRGLEHELEVDLQNTYKRRLQRSDLSFLKQKGFNAVEESDSVLRWLYNVFFTNHPMQFLVWLITLNTVYFIAMAIDGAGVFDSNVYKLVKWGAVSKEPVLQGGYWRLFTACFIHSGIGHLLSNMVGLLMASVFLVVIINKWQFLVGYMVTGVVGFAVSVWWHNDVIAVGASGAVFGCYGMLIGLTITPLLSTRDRITIAVYMAIYVGINLVASLKAGIDGSAHVGGLLAGVAIGIIYYYDLTWQRKKVWYPVMHVVVITVGLINCFVLLKSSHYHITDLSRMEREYTRLEKEGLLYYRTPDTTAGVETMLLKKSIPKFEKALAIADSMRREEQSADYRLYTNRLYTYTQYRLAALKLRLRVYDENSNVWNDSIIKLEQRVDSLLEVFHAGENNAD